MRMMSFELNGTPATPVLGEGKFDATSLDDNGAGDYTINFAEAFLRVPQVTALSRTASVHVRCVASKTACQVLCFSDLAETTPVEADVDVIVLGADSPDQI